MPIIDRDLKKIDRQRYHVRAYVQLSPKGPPHTGGFVIRNLSRLQVISHRCPLFSSQAQMVSPHNGSFGHRQYIGTTSKCHELRVLTHQCRPLHEPIEAAETSDVFIYAMVPFRGVTTIHSPYPAVILSSQLKSSTIRSRHALPLLGKCVPSKSRHRKRNSYPFRTAFARDPMSQPHLPLY